MKLRVWASVVGILANLIVCSSAQTFSVLHVFSSTSGPSQTNTDGAKPRGILVLVSNALYGLAQTGGSSGVGTVYKVNSDGTGFTNLYEFKGLNDGAYPSGLVASGNTIFGSASSGGPSGYGTLFKINNDGSGFTNFYRFSGSNGESGPGRLILSSDTLYGIDAGTNSAIGAVFKISANGVGLTNIYTFSPIVGPSYTNNDGAYPQGFIISNNILYGACSQGGTYGYGTVFRINIDGSGFTNLHSFSGSDGRSPGFEMALSGNVLFGTTSSGGSSFYGGGVIFRMNTDGSAFTNVLDFGDAYPPGFEPGSGLILSGSTLYGTTTGGGNYSGTIFQVGTDGEGYTNLYSFTPYSGSLLSVGTNVDGADPSFPMILSSNTLYGTTFYGGSSNGTVFSLVLPPPPPQLTIVPSYPYVILTWPTNAVSFTLQSTTNLSSSLAWTNVTSGQVVIGGQNVVSNPIATARQIFYRLAR